jgi:hypothetical protein
MCSCFAATNAKRACPSAFSAVFGSFFIGVTSSEHPDFEPAANASGPALAAAGRKAAGLLALSKRIRKICGPAEKS